MPLGSKPTPILVAIVGGSGSGKSWLAQKLKKELGSKAGRLSLDDFYRDRSHLSSARRARVNFDHPRAIDWQEVRKVVEGFLSGRATPCPTYDFNTHCRRLRSAMLKPKAILLLDGLWLLRPQWLRRLFALSIFLECPTETRLRRRLERDQVSRGRSRESVARQFRTMVEPMHRRFVAGQSRRAHVVLDERFGPQDVRRLAGQIGELYSGQRRRAG